MKSAGGKIRSGVLWSGFALVGTQGISFVVKMVLARLLVPEQFGVVGMALVFTGLIATINELGLAAALIQRKDTLVSEGHFSAAFYMSMALGVGLFLIAWLGIAPFAAAFYGQPELTGLTTGICLPLLINPLGLIPRARLTRDLRFRELTSSSLIASVIAGAVAVGAAWAGAGAWALVAQGVTAAIVTIGLNLVQSPWWPRASFHFRYFRELFDYSAYVTLNNVCVYFIRNVDYLIIGRMVGAYQLGLYTLAFTVADLFRSQIMGVLNKVLFPVFSRIQDDPAAIRAHYLKVIHHNSLILLPAMAIMAMHAELLIGLAFGEGWIAAAVPLRYLCAAAAVHAAGGASSTVLMATGRARLDFWLYLITGLLVSLPLIYFGTLRYGIVGCASGVMVGRAISIVARQVYLRRILGTSAGDVLRANRAGLLSALAAIGAAAGWRLAFAPGTPALDLLGLFASLAAGLLVNRVAITALVRSTLSGRAGSKPELAVASTEQS